MRKNTFIEDLKAQYYRGNMSAEESKFFIKYGDEVEKLVYDVLNEESKTIAQAFKDNHDAYYDYLKNVCENGAPILLTFENIFKTIPSEQSGFLENLIIHILNNEGLEVVFITVFGSQLKATVRIPKL